MQCALYIYFLICLSYNINDKLFYREVSGMYKYKVETYKVNDAAEAMNALAAQGWRVIAVSPNVAFGFGIVVTYEKKTDN